MRDSDKAFLAFGTMFSGIAMFLFFCYPYWKLQAYVTTVEGVVGILLCMAGVFMTIVGYILVMEVMIESKFKRRDKSQYPYTPRESYFDED